MPDCKPFSLLCTKNFLALAGAFLVTIAQGGGGLSGRLHGMLGAADVGGARRGRISPRPRSQSALPGGTGYPCPGGEDHLKRRSSSPPVPPLLGCRHCSEKRSSAGFALNRRLPCAGCQHGKDCKCRAPSSPGDARGEAPCIKNQKSPPSRREGGWGDGGRIKTKGGGGKRQGKHTPPPGTTAAGRAANAGNKPPPPGAWFASLFQCRPGSAPGMQGAKPLA